MTTIAAEEAEPIVLTDAKIDPDHFILEGIDTSAIPLRYSVSEIGKVFFARTPHWVRWLYRQEKVFLDGKPVAMTKTEKGSRVYTLSDVEQFTHALAQNGAISGQQARHALALVAIEAQVWGLV